MNVSIYRKRTNLPNASASSKLAKELGVTSFCSRLTPPSGNTDVILNWGNSSDPVWSRLGYIWINNINSIIYSSNKEYMFLKFTQNNIPTYKYFLLKDLLPINTQIVARHLVSSHSGKGIEIFNSYYREFIPDAPLYTVFEQHDYEVRLYVVNGKVVHYVQKAKMSSKKLEDKGFTFDPIVKTYKNGWVFKQNDKVELTPAIEDLAVKAMEAVGLGFGCVDIAFTDPNEPIVVETNSAPGLRSPTTLKVLAQSIKEEYL